MGNFIKKLFNSRALHPRFMSAVALISVAAIAGAALAERQEEGAEGLAATEQGARPQNVIRSHAFSVFGAPKYAQNFRHFAYVNPDAPKGGEISTAVAGSYDSLNDFILKGNAAQGLYHIYDSLLTQSDDEAGTAYGLLAQSVEMPQDKSWIIFHLREEARWHDGVPVTAEDVVWTFETLKDKGKPQYQLGLRDVTSVEALDRSTVKVTFTSGNNKTLPLTIGQLPVLPKHYWEGADIDFAQSSNTQPLGSGPYRIASHDLGQRITYERVEDYWGKDLAVNRGRHNFDSIRYEYFFDESSGLMAFGSGLYNFRLENQATRWSTGYDGLRALREGHIVKEEIAHDVPAPYQAFYFNTRREKFQDPRVREALSIVFNFEWSNHALAFGAYQRTNNIFENSAMASSGVPEGREREILEEYRGQIPDRIFSEEFRLPEYEQAGADNPNAIDRREGLKRAFALLKEAGYEYQGTKLVHGVTGKPLEFEFMALSQGIVRWLIPYAADLKRLGIETNIRLVDSSQYVNRLNSFDFDVMLAVIGQPTIPGMEQFNYWHSTSADSPGALNLAGVKDPVVDALVERVNKAKTEEEMVATARALDRVLLHGYYAIPHLHISKFRVAYYNELARPESDVRPRYRLGNFDTWWHKGAGPEPSF